MNTWQEIKLRAKDLGTDNKTISVFHQALKDDFFLDDKHILPCDSTIFCFEKIRRNKLISDESKIISWREIKQLYKIDYASMLKSISSKKNIASINRFLFGTKKVTLTHSIEFKNQKHSIPYSIYESKPYSNTNYVENSFSYYKQFKSLLAKKLESENYSHIIIGSTGWNNNQSESIKSYHKWQNELMKINKNGDYKPYFIGITWPSYWKLFNSELTAKIDYFNKANDADELGMLNINYLIWKVIMPCLNESPKNVKVILLGHSFGARILSRAAHSRLFFKDYSKNHENLEQNTIDRFFIFQGAFNINRYLPINKGESGIYAIDSPVELTIATSSLYDKAVPLAFCTSHIGSKKTLKRFNSRGEYSYSKFDLIYGNSYGKISGSKGVKSHKIVIADEFIRNHNDVFNEKAAALIKQFWV